jgi:hypothetical protein
MIKLQTPFINDMFSIFYKAFQNICPKYVLEKSIQIQWVNDIEPIDGEEVSGVTRFVDDGTIEIEILTRQSITDAVETLIHELAHVIVGPIKEHGEAFHKICDALVEEYTRILDEDFNDCITLELCTTENI